MKKKESDEIDEILASRNPLYFKRPRKKIEFKPLTFKSTRNNKFDYAKYKKDHLVKDLIGNSSTVVKKSECQTSSISKEQATLVLKSSKLPFVQDHGKQDLYRSFLVNITHGELMQTPLNSEFEEITKTLLKFQNDRQQRFGTSIEKRPGKTRQIRHITVSGALKMLLKDA